VHGGIFHLLFNALWIVAFGRAVADHLGAIGLIVFFLLTSAVGGFFGLAAHWGEPTIVIGASAAVFGLIGAGAYVLTQGVTVGRKIGAMVGYVAVFMGLNLGFALMGGESFGVEGAISWQAHAGGLAAGLVLFPIIAAIHARRSRAI
jgi:membrane associated rhomboid family serine protease